MRLLYKLLFIIFVPVLFLFALSSFGTPLLQATTASGSLIFNEIMYNPNGNDTNHEWLEIYNSGVEGVDLNGWKVSKGNSNTNHSISLVTGNMIIPSGGYAIFTASESVFLNDYPGFSGTVMKVAFSSLLNTNDTVILKSGSGSIVDTVTYSNSIGGSGNGKTIGKNMNGIWQESFDIGGTPGSLNIFSSHTNSNTNSDNENTNINTNSDDGNSNNNTNENDNVNQNENCSLLSGDVVINELLPAPSSNSNSHEWIELYNKKDCTIDLSGWTLDDASSSPKTLSGSIFPGGYKVLEPSPISLNNTGDIVLLKHESTVIDDMCYGNVNGCLSPASLPTYNQSLARFPNGIDTDQESDFKIFGSPTKGTENIINNHAPIAILDLQYPYKTAGNAPFSVNVTGERSYDNDGDTLSYFWDYGDGTIATTNNPLSHKYYFPGSYTLYLTVMDSWGMTNTGTLYITVYPSTITGVSTSVSSIVSCVTRETSSFIQLSEFLPNPIGSDSANEFIEIVNHDTKPINLCGWTLDDKEGGSKAYTIGNVTIQPEEYIIFYSKETKIVLNNDEDDVRLIDPFGKILEQVHYNNPPEGKSYAKIKKDKISYLSPKLLASIDLSIGLTDTPYVWAWGPPTPEQPNDTPVIFQGIVINELLPNPEGLDTEGEFIELKNTTENAMDLQGWQLSDTSGTTYTFKDPTNINANSVLTIPYNQSKITLNNDTDTLQLLDNNSGLQDEILYIESLEGKSYSRFINNPSYPQDSTWEWVIPTPGTENEREKLDVQAEPAGGIYHGPVSVSLLANKPNTKIFYSFSGDATPDEQYEYTKPIVLRSSSELWFFGFTDEQNSTLIKTEKYTIQGASLTATGSVIISESYPNPEKADSGKEWIELRNISTDPIDISAWYITNKLHQKISVPDHTTLVPAAYYVLSWHDVAFHLVNTSDILSLYNTDGIWQDEMSYNHVKTKQSIIRIELNNMIYNISTPSDFPTPGENNRDELQLLSKKTTRNKQKKKTVLSYDNTVPPTVIVSKENENLNQDRSPITDVINPIEYENENSANVIKTDITKSMNTPYATYLLLGMAIFVIVLAGILFFYRKKQ